MIIDNENSPDSYHTQYIHKIGFLFIHNIPDLKVYRHTSNRGTGEPEPETPRRKTGNSPVRYTPVRSLNKFRGAVSSDNLLVETPGEQSCHTHFSQITYNTCKQGIICGDIPGIRVSPVQTCVSMPKSPVVSIRRRNRPDRYLTKQ